MIDVSYFQTNNANTQIFQNGGTWQTWIKPKNAKIVNFFVVGAGGGGGGGFSGTGIAHSGGGSGGSGGNVKLTIQASLLPDILYIFPGTGGLGGAGGNPGTGSSGGNATNSYVCLTPDTSSASNRVLISGDSAARGGTGAISTSGGGGTGETVAVVTLMIFANLGTFLATAGIAGTGGSTSSSTGNTVTAFTVGASGGGGYGTAGGITAGGPFPTVANTGVRANGSDGLIFYKPIFGVSGGRGGGGSEAPGLPGGKGGNGAPGCGGGGGGFGLSVGTAGNGGNGGDGFVIITTNF